MSSSTTNLNPGVAKVLLMLLTTTSFVKVVSALDPPAECVIQGDQDVLGLGVRLGFYFQLLSNLLLGTICPSDAAKAFLPNLFFIIALVCAAIYSSAKENFPPGSIIACTWYPLLAYVALLPFLFHRLPDDLPPSQIMASAAVVAASSGFSMWFWYKGLDNSHPGQCMEPRVFLAVNCSALGNVRTAFKVFSPLLIVLALGSGYSTWWFQSMCLSFTGALPDHLYVPPRRIRVMILGLIWLTLGIVASELQLKWNHVEGINSIETTGQIIPLTLGLLSVIQTLFAFRFVFQSWAMTIVGAAGKVVASAGHVIRNLPKRKVDKDGSSSPSVELNGV
jgi:hypothetical protein